MTEAAPFNLSPVDLASLFFTRVHDASSLAWPAAIVLSAVSLRASLTLPLAVYAQRQRALVRELRPLVRAWATTLAHDLRDESRRNAWPYERFQKEYARRSRTNLATIYADAGVRPVFSLLAPLSQFPVWVSASLALRRFADQDLAVSAAGTLPELPALAHAWSCTEFLLCPSLSLADPTMMLPVLLGASQLLNVELMMGSLAASKAIDAPSKAIENEGQQEGSGPPWASMDRATLVTNALRAVSVIIVPVASTVPSGIVLYWLSSSAFSVAQNAAMRWAELRAAAP
ncbi:membrane insertase OXA1/ALB3/YidC [Blastocladiella britannica]|nr:membrane insertase OXA1/ALB3/YidC [Blastocladiella britannica]